MKTCSVAAATTPHPHQHKKRPQQQQQRRQRQQQQQQQQQQRRHQQQRQQLQRWRALFTPHNRKQQDCSERCSYPYWVTLHCGFTMVSQTLPTRSPLGMCVVDLKAPGGVAGAKGGHTPSYKRCQGTKT